MWKQVTSCSTVWCLNINCWWWIDSRACSGWLVLMAARKTEAGCCDLGCLRVCIIICWLQLVLIAEVPLFPMCKTCGWLTVRCCWVIKLLQLFHVTLACQNGKAWYWAKLSDSVPADALCIKAWCLRCTPVWPPECGKEFYLNLHSGQAFSAFSTASLSSIWKTANEDNASQQC